MTRGAQAAGSMTRLPLYAAALMLTTAALYAAGLAPRYVAVLVVALGLLTFAYGTWQLTRRG